MIKAQLFSKTCYFQAALPSKFQVVVVEGKMRPNVNNLSGFMQPGRDSKGAALALFTARLHRPELTTHKAVLQAIIYQLDKAIERYTYLATCN